MIRFLTDGMVGSDDWRVLKRRHGWDLLASLFQCAGSDFGLRRGVFEVCGAFWHSHLLNKLSLIDFG